MEALQVIGGVLALLALYIITMLVYFAVKQKFVHKKYAVEVTVIAVALLISAVMRFIIIFPDEEYGSILSRVLFAVYSAIGGFSFEGLDVTGLAELPVIYGVLYCGAALYTGLVVLSVITVGVSYEISSYLKAVILKIRLIFDKRTDVYLFTSATEDVLLLANDVQKRYREGGVVSDGKPRKCVIIFSGAELEAFDRKSELHREIMSRGYIYWSYSRRQNSDKEKSLLKRFNLRVKNYVGGKRSDTRVRVFALKLGETLTGLESENSDIVFDEIGAELREFVKKKGGALRAYASGGKEDGNLFKNTVVNFYILTDSDVNFGLYRRKVNQMIEKAVSTALHGDKGNPERLDEIKGRMKEELQLHILNEAILSAESMIRHRTEEYLEEDGNGGILWEQSMFAKDLQPDADNIYRVGVLGFGKTGQHAMNTLFIQTAYADKNGGAPSRFVAEVFDSKMDSVSGTFEYTHPLFHCITGGDGLTSAKEVEEAVKKGKLCDTCKPLYEKYGKVSGIEDEEAVKEKVEKLMGFPVAVLHNASCFGAEFMRNLDKNLAGANKKGKFAFKAFIISLGNDEANINMANALIDDFKHEALAGNARSGFPQTLYVNIRDEKNYGKLNWETADKARFSASGKSALKVVPFGKREEMYGYDAIINDYEASLYHCAYGSVTEDLNTPYVKSLISALDGGTDGDFMPAMLEWGKRAKVFEEKERRESWLKVSPQDKLSNESVCSFGAVYAAYMRGKTALDGQELSHLAEWEHTRWNRFHMVGGWVYADYAKAEKAYRRNNKEHTCLCPFDMLDGYTKIYDVANIVISMKDLI